MVVSVGFELLEYTFEVQLPNFGEGGREGGIVYSLVWASRIFLAAEVGGGKRRLMSGHYRQGVVILYKNVCRVNGISFTVVDTKHDLHVHVHVATVNDLQLYH